MRCPVVGVGRQTRTRVCCGDVIVDLTLQTVPACRQRCGSLAPLSSRRLLKSVRDGGIFGGYLCLFESR